MTDRVNLLPHNLDAERSVLGSVLVDNSIYIIVEGWLTKENVFYRSHTISSGQLCKKCTEIA